MPMVTISVKWSGKKFDGIQVDVTQPATTLKHKLFELTKVEPERQKVMVKGGMLKDDADLAKLLQDVNIPNLHLFLFKCFYNQYIYIFLRCRELA